jgi:hypothetical protein
MQPATRIALDNRADPSYLKPLLVVTLAIGSAPELSICCSSPRPRVTYTPRGGSAPMTCTPRYLVAPSPAPVLRRCVRRMSTFAGLCTGY